jgi:hypothetical protein
LENGGNGQWRKLTAVSKNLVAKLFQGAWLALATPPDIFRPPPTFFVKFGKNK